VCRKSAGVTLPTASLRRLHGERPRLQGVAHRLVAPARVHHDALGIALHGSSHGDERLAVRNRLQGPIRGSQAKLRRAHGYLLLDDHIGTTGLDGHVEALLLVEALR